MRSPPEKAAQEGADFGLLCSVARPAEECERRCDAEFNALTGNGAFYQSTRRRACLLAVYAEAPDPAPELAGGPLVDECAGLAPGICGETGPSIDDIRAEATFLECMGEDRPHAECEALREGGR